VSFTHASLLTAELPTADLIIARDVLFHLNTAHIHAALSNIRRSNSRLLLTTTFPGITHNKDLEPKAGSYLGFAPQPDRPVWGYREINLDIEPFALGESGLESGEESSGQASWDDDDSLVASTRQLKLYSLPPFSAPTPPVRPERGVHDDAATGVQEAGTGAGSDVDAGGGRSRGCSPGGKEGGREGGGVGGGWEREREREREQS
jgi:hypothetical protein